MASHERAVALDTETTGFKHSEGDRIVEIGAVELVGNIETGRTFHVYLNPYPRPVSQGAFEVHGLSTEFLMDKPKFRDVYHGFVDFIGDSPLIIHNAAFDVGFINAEFERMGRRPLTNEIRDTLRTARDKYPGQRVSLDALCSRLGVDNSRRDLHGALIDASLLAQVYVKMMELDRLALLPVDSGQADSVLPVASVSIPRRPFPRRAPLDPTQAELAAHEAFISSAVKDSLWVNP
jgi:DNA polymerase III, epsilon subunit, Proteobacterial